ncbi:MAG TPA: hypothetical protein VGK47_09610 [Nitrososphaeraceae archaeon]
MQNKEILHYTKLPIYEMRVNLHGSGCTPIQFLTLLVAYHENVISSYFMCKINLAGKNSSISVLRTLKKKGLIEETEKSPKGYKKYKITSDGIECVTGLYHKIFSRSTLH